MTRSGDRHCNPIRLARPPDIQLIRHSVPKRASHQHVDALTGTDHRVLRQIPVDRRRLQSGRLPHARQCQSRCYAERIGHLRDARSASSHQVRAPQQSAHPPIPPTGCRTVVAADPTPFAPSVDWLARRPQHCASSTRPTTSPQRSDFHDKTAEQQETISAIPATIAAIHAGTSPQCNESSPSVAAQAPKPTISLHRIVTASDRERKQVVHNPTACPQRNHNAALRHNLMGVGWPREQGLPAHSPPAVYIPPRALLPDSHGSWIVAAAWVRCR